MEYRSDPILALYFQNVIKRVFFFYNRSLSLRNYFCCLMGNLLCKIENTKETARGLYHII